MNNQKAKKKMMYETLDGKILAENKKQEKPLEKTLEEKIQELKKKDYELQTKIVNITTEEILKGEYNPLISSRTTEKLDLLGVIVAVGGSLATYINKKPSYYAGICAGAGLLLYIGPAVINLFKYGLYLNKIKGEQERIRKKISKYIKQERR